MNDTITLSASVLPAAASQEVEWSSSDEDVATVDENGVVTGVAGGSCSITATSTEDNTVKVSVEITVSGTLGD